MSYFSLWYIFFSSSFATRGLNTHTHTHTSTRSRVPLRSCFPLGKKRPPERSSSLCCCWRCSCKNASVCVFVCDRHLDVTATHDNSIASSPTRFYGSSIVVFPVFFRPGKKYQILPGDDTNQADLMGWCENATDTVSSNIDGRNWLKLVAILGYSFTDWSDKFPHLNRRQKQKKRDETLLINGTRVVF